VAAAKHGAYEIPLRLVPTLDVGQGVRPLPQLPQHHIPELVADREGSVVFDIEFHT